MPPPTRRTFAGGANPVLWSMFWGWFAIRKPEVPKTDIRGLHYTGTTPDMAGTVTKPGNLTAECADGRGEKING